MASKGVLDIDEMGTGSGSGLYTGTDTTQKSSVDPTKVNATDYVAPGAVAGPTAWNPREEDLASGQLTKLLQQDNPYIAQARTRASQIANQRGLLNSSIAASAGESAAIDAALPIAQANAGVLAEAGKYNADAANTFTSQGNEFARTSALTQAKGVLDTGLQANELAARRDEQAQQAGQFEAQQALERERLAQQQGQFQTQQAAEAAGRQQDLSRVVAQLRSEASNAVAQIEGNPNMDEAAKQNAVTNILNIATANIAETIRLSGIDLPDAWPEWLSSFSRTANPSAPAAGSSGAAGPAPAPWSPGWTPPTEQGA